MNNGSFRTKGGDRIALPAGVPFHRLASMDDDWPYKGKTDHTFPQNLGYRYKGYTLDAQRRPTFSYRYGEIDVTDFFEDVVDAEGQAYFRRRVQFTATKAQAPFYFRVAAGKNVSSPSVGNYQVERLHVRVVRGDTAMVRDGEPSEVLLPVTLPPGKTTVVLEYQW